MVPRKEETTLEQQSYSRIGQFGGVDPRSKLLLTIPEAAHLLGLGRSFFYKLVMRGDILSIKIGRSRRIPVQALEQFVAEQIEENSDSNSDSNSGGH